MNPLIRCRRGFTLIELLTVIAIIGILAAIIIPTVGKVRDSARDSTCKSNLRQIGLAMQLYAADNRNILPPAGVTGDLANTNWKFAIGTYLSASNGQKSSTDALRCPARSQAETGADRTESSYSLNPRVFAEVAAGGSGTPLSKILRPSETILAADAVQRATGDTHARMFGLTMVSDVIAQADTALSGLPVGDISPSESATVSFRHGGNSRLNVVRADASVRAFGNTELLNRHFSILRY